ncbi:retrotransposon ty3-gypsy subclass, partial [Cystoisospora suis]
MVVDYRALNGIPIKDNYPLPRIHDLINRLGKARWFSKTDLQDTTRWRLAKLTSERQRFTPVMPFGLAGPPSTFQRLMKNIFLDELEEFVTVYLDDVLIYSKTRDEHIQHLRRVFEKLREEKLYIKLSKRPIPNSNKLAHPLHELLRDGTDMVWRMQHSEAVKNLKEALINVATLKIFDPDKPVVLKTDASKHAIGAVLEQVGVPIAFEPQKMGKRESFMPDYKSELLAIVHALMKWKSFIGSKKHVTSRLGYWLDKLADFNINVVYKPGKQNVVADAISRRQDFIGLTKERSRGSYPSRITETEFWREQYELCADFNIPCKAVAKSSNNEQ